MASTAQSSHAPASVHGGPSLDNRRIAAAGIDLIAPALALLALMAGGLLTPAVALVVLGWTLFYFFALESGDGQTMGKRAMSLRVVSADGGSPTMRQYASRNAVRVLDLPLVGLIAMIASGDRRQRLGDRAAKTMVVEAGSTSQGDELAQTRQIDAPLAEVAPEEPRSRRGLGGPEIKMPKLPGLRRPALKRSGREVEADSVAATTEAPPKRSRPSLGGPEIKLPSFGRKKKASAPAEPVAMDPEPIAEPLPEVKPFDPFADDAPTPTVEIMRPDGDPDPMSDEPVVVADPFEEAEVPDVQVVHPSSEFDSDPSPVPAIPEEPPAAEPHPAAEEPPDTAEPEVEPSDAVRDDGSPRLSVKPIETVSPLELLMQEAEERDRPPEDSSL